MDKETTELVESEIKANEIESVIEDSEIKYEELESEIENSGSDKHGKKNKKKMSKRKLKNIIMIPVAVLLMAAMVFTSGVIKFGKATDMPQGGGGQQPPQMSQEQGDSSDDSDSSDKSEGESAQSTENGDGGSSSDQQTPPEKPDGDSTQSGDSGSSSDQQTPPEKPDGDSAEMNSGDSSSGSDQQTPPEKPDGDSAQGSDGQTPPEMPDGDSAQSGDSSSDSDSAQQQGNPGEMPSNMGGMNNTLRIVLICIEALAFALILIYLIMSCFNKRTFKETLANKKKIIAFVAASMVAAAGLSAAATILPNKLMLKNMQQGDMQQGTGGGEQQDSSSSVEATGANTVDGEETELNDEYTSETADENVILVKNGGTLTSTGATITKKSGDGSNTDNCDFYGINAAVLVNSKSSATIKNATITTKANRSNAVFCTGEGSNLTISNSTIKTAGESSCRGLDATYGGSITASKVNISTEGGSCATLATDRGEGTVKVTNSELKTEGAGSPLIYSTGNISISKTTGTAEGSQMVVVEGKNSATVKNSTLTCEGTGNRGDVDVCGVMLYQSMSGDADEGTSSFTATGSKLSIDEGSNYYDSAPMFFVTNTDAVIKLTDSELNFGSGVLLSAQGTSEWGETDANGGSVKLTANKQVLAGDIVLDSLSTLKLNLKNGSSYEGTINGDKKAKSIKLTLSKDSKIVLTGDSYVTSLDDEDSSYSNIDFNGHKLYVNGKAVSK